MAPNRTWTPLPPWTPMPPWTPTPWDITFPPTIDPFSWIEKAEKLTQEQQDKSLQTWAVVLICITSICCLSVIIVSVICCKIQQGKQRQQAVHHPLPHPADPEAQLPPYTTPHAASRNPVAPPQAETQPQPHATLPVVHVTAHPGTAVPPPLQNPLPPVGVRLPGLEGSTTCSTGTFSSNTTLLPSSATASAVSTTGVGAPLETPNGASHQNFLSAGGASGDGSDPVTPCSPLNGWTRGKLLGQGAFGSVFIGILSNGSLVAVKVIALEGRAEELAKVQKEVEFLQQLRHPNVISYKGSLVEEARGEVHVFMEYAVGGSLSALVKACGTPLSEKVAALFIKQVLEGLAFLHGHGVMHRDIKGENVLLDAEGHVKLADFGCARVMATATAQATFAGTPYWMAPEVIQNKKYNKKADVWSVGCTAIEVLTRGSLPWVPFESVYAAMFEIARSESHPTNKPAGVSPACSAFFDACFQREPSSRPDARELLDHRWLREAADAQPGDVTERVVPTTRQTGHTAPWPSVAEVPPGGGTTLMSSLQSAATLEGVSPPSSINTAA